MLFLNVNEHSVGKLTENDKCNENFEEKLGLSFIQIKEGSVETSLNGIKGANDLCNSKS